MNECYSQDQGIKQKYASSSNFELFSYYYPTDNVEVSFCYGVAPENLGEIGRYKETDIVLSFSLVAGLHPEWKSGSLFIPKRHIPFSLNEVTLDLETGYLIYNHLEKALPEIVKQQDADVIKIINEEFASLNQQKQDLKAVKLSERDFKEATLLQADGIFNPSQLPPKFNLIESQNM